MGVYKKPNVFFTGVKSRAKELIGFSNAFRFKTELWNKEKYYSLSTKLEDGSLVTIKKLMNGELYTYIDTPIPEVIPEIEEEVGEVSPFFYLALNESSEILTDPSNINTEDNQKIMLVSVDSETGETKGVELPDTNHKAGNLDWNYEYTWHGHIKRDFPIFYEGSIPGSDIIGYPGSVLAGEFPVISDDSGGTTSTPFYYYSRYTTKVFKNGEAILDTDENNSEVVLGYANINGYHLVITLTDFRKDTIWKVKDDIWIDIGKIQYVSESDDEHWVVGRSQAVTFSPDGTKFTGVIIVTSSERRFNLEDFFTLTEGDVTFDVSGEPTGISYTLTSVSNYYTRDIESSGSFSEPGNYFDTTSETRTIPEPLPLASAYKLDNTLNILYLSDYSFTSNRTRTETSIPAVSISNTVTSSEEEIREFTAFNLSKTGTRLANTSSSGNLSLDLGTQAGSINSSSSATWAGLSWFDYVDLKNEIYVYTSSSGDQSSLSTTTFDASLPFVGNTSLSSTNTESISDPDLFFNEVTLVNREGFSNIENSTSETSLTVFDFFDLVDIFKDSSLGPSNPSFSFTGQERFPLSPFDFKIQGFDIPRESTICSTDESGNSLISHTGTSEFNRLQSANFPIPWTFDPVQTLTEAYVIKKDQTKVQVDWNNIYSSQGLTVGIDPRFWHTTSISDPEIAICLTNF